MDSVYIVIVNYNFGELLIKCINSIDEDKINYRIIIFDNNSSDGSIENLEKQNLPSVHIIRSNENIGFSAGCNRSFRYITTHFKNPGYLFLLNPDAVIPKDLIWNLLTTLKDKNADLVSPKILHENGDLYYTGGNIDLNNLEIDNTPEYPDNTGIRETNLFHGAAVLIKTEIFEKSGGLNEDLFLYYDEADMSMRIHELGGKIFYNPDLVVTHNVSFSTKNNSFIKTYYMTRNHLFFFWENSKSNKIYSFVKLFKHLVWRIAVRFKHFDFKGIRYLFLGLFHFLINKKGKLILKNLN